jgi:hypothetical protein
MDPRLLVAHTVKLVILATLVGLYARGRSRRCYAVVAYLWFALIGNSMTTFWPRVFFNFDFWVLRQAVFDFLKLAIGVEIAVRAFAAFPGARAAWERLVAVAVVIGTTLAMVFVPHAPTYGIVFARQPHVVAATVWLFTITALVVVYYKIPIDPWHRAILLGLTPYQFVFTTIVAMMAELGTPMFAGLSIIDSGAYLLLMGWWAQSAWRPEEAIEASAETRRLLQLERV